MRAIKSVKSLGFAKKARGARRVEITAFFLRHADKSGETLSPFGQKRAGSAGRFLRGRIVFSSSTVPRAVETAERLARAAGQGQIVSQHSELNYFNCVRDLSALEKLGVEERKKFPSEEKLRKQYPNEAVFQQKLFEIKEKADSVVTRKWLDGKIPTSIIMSPKEVSDSIIRRLEKNIFSAKAAGKNVSVNVSHADFIVAVFERLTGRRFDLLRPKNQYARPLEGMRFDFLKSGRIILRYRGKRFDVTKCFNEIVSKR